MEGRGLPRVLLRVDSSTTWGTLIECSVSTGSGDWMQIGARGSFKANVDRCLQRHLRRAEADGPI